MSRALRKLQKQELQPLEPESDEEVIESKGNLFDMLSQDDVESAPEQVSDKEMKVPIPKKKPRSKKKNRVIAKADDDDIDKAIQEVNEKLGFLPMVDVIQPPENDNLFLLDKKYFDAELELFREFGMGPKPKSKTKRSIVNKKQGWPVIPSFGVSMHFVIEEQGLKYFEFSRTEQYSSIQQLFFQCISTHNPQAFMNLVAQYPFHLDSLLQLSEVFKQQGEASTASDYIQRCIYYLELCFHHSFQFQLGNCRLLYDIPENRILHLAIFRYIEFVSRQGCWRAAFELQKFLYTLDPEFDPLCSLYGLDVLAIKAKEYEWFDKFWSRFHDDLKISDTHPGSAFSIALCKWELERSRGFNHESSRKYLKEAICKYPQLLKEIYSKASFVDPFPGYTVKPHDFHDALVFIYTEDTSSFWKVPEIQSWLKDVVSSISMEDLDQKLTFEPLKFQIRNLQRVIVMREINSLYRYLPPNGMDNLVAFDPLPPLNEEESESLLTTGVNSIYQFLFGQ